MEDILNNNDSSDEEIKSLSPTFDLISDEIINKWEKILKSNNLEKARLITEDINFDDYNLSYDCTQTIKNDSHRTRVRERFSFPDFEITLQKILIYYCKLNNLEYKQGLNEVLGPFLLLKIKLPKLNMCRIYNLFTLFIDYFLPNYFYEPELFSFRSSVSLVTLLLKYHDPKLFNLFEQNNISAEMYSINWLLTTFTNKNSLEITYTLWDIIIEENDQLFIHFMIISFLNYHRKKFLETDGSSIPVFFSKIQISTKEQLSEIVMSAREIRKNTPLSLRILVKNLEIFKSRTTRVKEMYEKYNPEQMLAMPVLPEELFSKMYINKKSIPCPNEKCENFFLNIDIKDNIDNKDENKKTDEAKKTNIFCEICRIHNFKNNIKYIIIDLRNKNDSSTKYSIANEGTLLFINNEILPQDMLNKNNVGEFLSQQINNLRDIENKEKTKNNDENISNNNMHIVLMTNDTDNYDEFEYNYQETQSNSKKLGVTNILNSAITSIKKKLDDQKNKNQMKPETIQQLRLQIKQYELIKNILLTLIEKEYPYISYIYGGYKSIHNLCLKYNINIIDHKPNNCYICMNKYLEDSYNNNEPSYKIINKTRDYPINLVRRFNDTNRKKSEAKKLEEENNKSNLKNRVLEELPVIEMNEFLNDKKNKIYHCLLVWHNMNDINEKIIFIVFEKLIQIFKMNVKKDGIFFDVIEKIDYGEVKDIKRVKNVFNLYYKKGDKNNDLKIDTFTDNDGESFFKLINSILEKNKEKKNFVDNQ